MEILPQQQHQTLKSLYSQMLTKEICVLASQNRTKNDSNPKSFRVENAQSDENLWNGSYYWFMFRLHFQWFENQINVWKLKILSQTKLF